MSWRVSERPCGAVLRRWGRDWAAFVESSSLWLLEEVVPF